jgi:hypothetical protein
MRGKARIADCSKGGDFDAVLITVGSQSNRNPIMLVSVVKKPVPERSRF